MGGCDANEVVEKKDVESLGVEDDNLVGRTERVQGSVGGEEPISMEDNSWTLLAIEHSKDETSIHAGASSWSATTRYGFGVQDEMDLIVLEDTMADDMTKDDIKEEILEEEEASNHCVHSCGRDDSMKASMTILSGPDTSSPPIEASEWERDLDYRIGHEDGLLLTDEDTVTYVASEATLC